MSYSVYLIDSCFNVSEDNMEAFEMKCQGFVMKYKYDFPHTLTYEKPFLENFFIELGWELELYDRVPESFNMSSNYLDDKFEKLLHHVAPVIKDGSYLRFCGEDQTLWEWYFKNGECLEGRPSWPSDLEKGDTNEH